MYYADYHCHSSISQDSTAPLLEDARAAIACGLSELCITDHFDLVLGYGERTHTLDWSPRLEQYHAVKAAVAGKLKLRLGMEFGSGQVDGADAAAILSQPELDFVIGSLHNRTLESGGMDFYYVNYTSSEQCYDMLDDYFLSMERLVEADCYDVLGHIIYLPRYMTVRDGQTVDLERYSQRIRGILKTAIAHGKGMELNTWCGRTLEEWHTVLSIFKDLGGEYITVGSDAHVTENIGKGVPEAYELLRSHGFRYVTTYEKRTPIQIPL